MTQFMKYQKEKFMKSKLLKMMKGLWLGHVVFAVCMAMDTALLSMGAYQLSEFVTKLEGSLWKAAAAAFGLYAVCQFGAVLFEYAGNLKQNRLEKEIRLKLRNRMSRRSLGYTLEEFGEKGSQQFLDGQMNSMEIFQQEFLENFYNAIFFTLLIANGCITLGKIYWKLAAAMLAAVVLSYFVSHFYDRALEKVTKNYVAAENRYTAAVIDMMDGFLDIYFNQVRNRFCVFAKRQNALYERAVKKYYIQTKGIGIVLYFPMFIADMGILSLIIYGVVRGETSIGALAAYINIGGLILNSSESLFNCVICMKGGMNALPEEAFEDCGANTEATPDEIASENVEARLDKTASENVRVTSDGAETSNPLFELENVRFEREGKTLLAIPSWNIEEGSKLVLTGKNGSGKSTLFKLLLKSLKPVEGTIRFRGQKIDDMSEEELFRQIAYLPQKGYLFEGTVYENIFFDNRVTETEWKEIIQSAGLAEFVRTHGMDCPVEAGGRNLSGGEKQRILIARALAQHKAVYLLDEPCAGINPSLAAEIERGFLTNPDWTVIMVSHELHDSFSPQNIIDLAGLFIQ
jgi:ATP-binding cassette subfamily C protein